MVGSCLGTAGLVVAPSTHSFLVSAHGEIGWRVMVMTLHKLTAGDGYLYLVRQVAAADDTQRGRSTLADYYSAKGEAPGRWLGRGLAALADAAGPDIDPQRRRAWWPVGKGSEVCAAQMRALFGEGLTLKRVGEGKHV